jgi:hypothetical protein
MRTTCCAVVRTDHPQTRIEGRPASAHGPMSSHRWLRTNGIAETDLDSGGPLHRRARRQGGTEEINQRSKQNVHAPTATRKDTEARRQGGGQQEISSDKRLRVSVSPSLCAAAVGACTRRPAQSLWRCPRRGAIAIAEKPELAEEFRAAWVCSGVPGLRPAREARRAERTNRSRHVHLPALSRRE